MRRILLLLLAILALFWWLGRIFRSLRSPDAGSRPSTQAGSVPEGRMVRDRVCNTFLPVSRALRLEVGSEEHFFCSEACRQRFLAGRPD
jgi:YHS domain-containing protein